MEAEVAVMCSEDGVRGHKPRNVDGLWKLGKTRKQILPSRASRRNAALLVF